MSPFNVSHERSAPEADPLMELGRGGVPRDGYGRALLIPRGMKTRAPYTSASSLAEYISNPYALHRWQQRYLARGLGMREDLAAVAGAETYTTSFGEEDDDENKASGRRLDAIITEAMQVARVDERANHGTAVHSLTEPGSRGYVPQRMRPDVDSFWRATRGLQIVATEIFVANDSLMAAGTFDHLVVGTAEISEQIEHDVTGTLLVGDKKTGRIKAPETAVQMAVYAGADVYDRKTNERKSFEEAFGMPINLEVGLFISIPALEGRTAIFPLDLVRGREAAEHAVWVRDWQRHALALGDPIDTDELTRREAARRMGGAASAAELTAIWQEFEDVWTDGLTEYAQHIIADRGLS